MNITNLKADQYINALTKATKNNLLNWKHLVQGNYPNEKSYSFEQEIKIPKRFLKTNNCFYTAHKNGFIYLFELSRSNGLSWDSIDFEKFSFQEPEEKFYILAVQPEKTFPVTQIDFESNSEKIQEKLFVLHQLIMRENFSPEKFLDNFLEDINNQLYNPASHRYNKKDK